MKYTVSGRDAYGNPVTETLTYRPLHRRIRINLACFVRAYTPWKWDLAYRLGLTKFRNISGIDVAVKRIADQVYGDN